MCDNPDILNLQYFKRDSYISVICQASDYAVEDRKADAVAHLAQELGVKIQDRHFGDLRKIGQLSSTAAFFIYLNWRMR